MVVPDARSNHNQSMANAERDSLGAAGCSQLPHNRCDVEFDGVFGDFEAGSHLLVSETGGEEAQDLGLARRSVKSVGCHLRIGEVTEWINRRALPTPCVAAALRCQLQIEIDNVLTVALWLLA